MPELPDVTLYVERLAAVAGGQTLGKIRLTSPFLLRSVEPSLSAVEGRALEGVSRLGKRIVLDFGDELFLVLHLMIAGRLRWKERGAPVPKKAGLAAFDFDAGTLLFTEAGSRKRASLHVVRGRAELETHDPGGLEVHDATPSAFRERLRERNHTLKRALTDPQLFSGIGNAYSDEILHHARLSPFKLTRSLDDGEALRLHESCVAVLREWTERLRADLGDRFPDKVTAFHEEMAVHGKYGQPCPDCGARVQRIVYATRESNYCAGCQTGGRLLADRTLSRLLKKDWPRTLEELEDRRGGGSK